MTPEAADYLQHSRRSLTDAQKALAAGIYVPAAREAYIAALNAARAIIFEKLTIASKTHTGTHALLHRLVHDGLKVDRRTLDILSKGFEVKTKADYGPYEELGEEEARGLVLLAETLFAQVESELGK